MNEWLKKLFSQIKEFWAKWSVIQKVIVTSILIVFIAALILVPTLSSQPTTSALFSVPVTDEVMRDNIVFRLAEENVPVDVRETGMMYVKDDATARRMRAILVTEDLVPNNVDPWAIFDVESWTTSDFKNDVNLQRAVTAQVKTLIEALDDIEKAEVMLSMPEKELFAADQDPVSVSVILTTKTGSMFTQDKKKIEGIQKLLLRAIAGLTAENIAIADTQGNVLNDFDGLADIERVDIIEKEQLLIASFEEKQRKKVLIALQQIYGSDRVRDLNISIDMDMSQQEIATTEYFPFTRIPDNPDTPYYDGEVFDSVKLSSQEIKKTWQGTGYNPEGPAGIEGQNPPVYSDMSNVYGLNEESSVTENNAINTRQVQEIRSPSQGRVTVSVNIDGRWERKYDEEGTLVITPNGRIERTYIPLTDVEITNIEKIIQGAIGYDKARGDSVVVQNVQFDRNTQFLDEDKEYARAEQTRKTVLISIISVISILVLFILVRLIMRELERRRRIREEEFLRKSQLERERTLWEAQQAGMEVTMSVEEREKAELYENAMAMAREHPEDIAMLIRTWLMEE